MLGLLLLSVVDEFAVDRINICRGGRGGGGGGGKRWRPLVKRNVWKTLQEHLMVTFCGNVMITFL